MARQRSLKPQLNQIRAWVRQGRTDAWIAHQLDVTVQQIAAFKRENDLAPAGEDEVAADEVDLRAEDDALIAEQLEQEEARREQEGEDEDEDEGEGEDEGEDEGEGEGEDGDGEQRRGGRRRGRRGGRRRKRTEATTIEGTFDHGEEGYGLWLDPAITDDRVYAEHWAGHRPVEVTIEQDRIVIRRVDGGD